ncbi:hypothetical protein JB92DRAFT_3095778 [Gautieria morchelliformis]|nr:hypothetical protein JB92DRAFT_3095778 [Gautieria morchelliformis]
MAIKRVFDHARAPGGSRHALPAGLPPFLLRPNEITAVSCTRISSMSLAAFDICLGEAKRRYRHSALINTLRYWNLIEIQRTKEDYWTRNENTR